jgi:hypothetical protein
MCAIGKCEGVWVALHGINHTILAVGGRGAPGKRKALAEAKWRQKKYGPPGRIPTIPDDEVNCVPMLRKGAAASRIRRELRELGVH